MGHQEVIRAEMGALYLNRIYTSMKLEIVMMHQSKEYRAKDLTTPENNLTKRYRSNDFTPQFLFWAIEG